MFKISSRFEATSFLLLFLLSIILLWPGEMTPDSHTAYTYTLTGTYSDNPPVAFVFTWSIANYLVEGPGGMLILQLTLLWGACFIFYRSYKHSIPQSRARILFLLAILFPPLWSCLGIIWKDLYFTFSYLIITALLTHKTLSHQKFSTTGALVLFSLLLFCTAFKYQARFVLAFPLCWLIALQWNRPVFSIRVLFIGGVSTLLAIQLMDSTLERVYTEKSNKHYWQYVKFYDLAGMSVREDQVLVPKTLWKKISVSPEDIKRKYSILWEPLITEPDSPFRATRTDAERKLLWDTWADAVLKHPLSYLQHRSKVMLKTLSCSDFKSYLRHLLRTHNLPIRPANIGLIFGLIFWLPFSFFYMWLGWQTRQKTLMSTPLLILNGMTLVYVGFLFVFSLASTARYVYFSVCCLTFSHPFGIACWKAFKNKRLLQSEITRGNKSHV